jgi:hypothetical protein
MTTASERKILQCLKDGGRIWSAAGRRIAYLCLADGRYLNCRRTTLNKLEEAGLLVSESAGEQYSDTHWHLAKPVGKWFAEIL